MKQPDPSSFSSSENLLGAGRSGQVYLVQSPEVEIARKIFMSDKLTKLVHYVFFGVPNPYIWNEDAIKCAYYRRIILKDLVRFWFGEQLKVSGATATGWNEEFKAYQLDTEFVKGRSIALCQPFTNKRRRELPTLTKQVMRPLQKQLIQSGFDGLVWQAGKGNPVALNNFLLIDLESDFSDNTDEFQFVWIDLESGVPALFPLNVLTLFTFYIPKSILHKRPMFDDVNMGKLKQYVKDYKAEITEQLGPEKYAEISDNVERLDEHQYAWKRMSGLDQSIQYQYKKGQLTQEKADWYSRHPLQWYWRELNRILKKLLFGLIKLPIKVFIKIWNRLKQIQYLQVLNNSWKALTSQRYRLNFVRNLFTERIKIWQDRDQLTDDEAGLLIEKLHQDRSSSYLVDLSIYLAIKVIVLVFEVTLLPVLLAMGIINEATFGLFVLMDGPILRTIYTLYRMLQSAIAGYELPWVALFIGLIPFVGNVAYACQVIYSTAGKDAKVPRFIVYDTFTHLGTKIPIWGGEDTLTEHTFNRAAYWLIYSLSSLLNRRENL